VPDADLERALLGARSAVLHDLEATGVDGPRAVNLVEDAVAARRWWLQQWPDGAAFVAGLVAQDVQDALLEESGRWPLCPRHATEALSVEPELGEDPHWFCAHGCGALGPIGGLVVPRP
jgi:hypothetical protein